MSYGALDSFTGGGQFYRHWSKRAVFSEGVKFLADEAGAYWLIDAIVSYLGSFQLRKAMEADDRLRGMQFWKLEVSPPEHAASNPTENYPSAVLTCRADSGVEPVIKQGIGYTDFPLKSVEIWVAMNPCGWTLFLPSEY